MCTLKNYGGKTKECPTILCPCPVPKRLLTSNNWICRNDSSNINAILHPENYLVSPRLKYGEKTKGNVIEKHILSRNNCYCRCKSKKLPQPTFFKRPNSCISYEEHSKSIDRVYNDDLKRQSLVDCVCDKAEDDLDATESLKYRLKSLKRPKSVPAKVGLGFSNQRQRYKEYHAAQKEKFHEDVEKYRYNESFLIEGGEGGMGDNEDINTILGTQNNLDDTSRSQIDRHRTYMAISRQDAGDNDHYSSVYLEKNVPDFRREHYFETHDIGQFKEMTGDVSIDHTCIHQFKLDQRGLPEPVSKDNYGRSLCKICEKSMESSGRNLSSGYFFSTEDGLSKFKLKNYAEAYKSGLMPKTINLSKGNSKIELVLNNSDIVGFGSYIRKTKYPVYCNSLALRHQKMRLI